LYSTQGRDKGIKIDGLFVLKTSDRIIFASLIKNSANTECVFVILIENFMFALILKTVIIQMYLKNPLRTAESIQEPLLQSNFMHCLN
jgi:hypothetical protein